MQIVGVVRAVNVNDGRVAIWVEEQDVYTIIEMLSSDDIELGDVITWTDRYGMGLCSYQNVTKEWQADVYVQKHDVPPDLLRLQLLL